MLSVFVILTKRLSVLIIFTNNVNCGALSKELFKHLITNCACGRKHRQLRGQKTVQTSPINLFYKDEQ